MFNSCEMLRFCIGSIALSHRMDIFGNITHTNLLLTFCIMSIYILVFTSVTDSKFQDGKKENYNYKKEISKYKTKYGTYASARMMAGDQSIESKVTFYLFTRETEQTPEVLIPGNISLLRNSHFDPSKPTKVLVHGFLDSVNGEMVTNLKPSLLDAMDVNIIVVDWSPITINFNYVDAAQRTEEVGQYLAKMLDFFCTQGYDFSGFHLIGHSLGAHVSGSAGRSVMQGMIPRISGLDPALPGFEIVEVGKRLRRSDAAFVDCIHTSSGLWGIIEPICHADFYANGGLHPQPGCPLIDLGKCSHFRAFEYFGESVNPNHRFPTLLCKTPFDDPSTCSKSTILMGYPTSPRARGVYYAMTASAYPYALNIL